MPEVISIDGVIGWDVTADSVRDQLKEANGKPIEVQISSPGGSVFAGISIFNLIKNYKGEKSTKIIGLAASMGSYIALATDKVSAEENAVYMIHNASTFSWGDHRELRKTANTIESLTNLLGRKYQAKTGKDKEEITALMDDETWLFGQEIVDAGFADEIFTSDDSDAQAESKEDAVALAKMSFEDCTAKLKEANNKEELEQIAAYFKGDKSEATGAAQLTQAPEAKTTQKGEAEMTPEEIEKMKAELAEANAKLEEKETAKDPNGEGTKVCAQALSVLKSDTYPAQAREIAAQVIEGKASEETLKAVVAIIDMQNEKAKSEEAKAEEEGLEPTPASMGEDTGIDKEGKITSEKGLQVAAAKIKGDQK